MVCVAISLVLCIPAGIILIAEGNHLTQDTWGSYDAAGYYGWGIALILLPLVAGGIMLLFLIVASAAEEHQRYKAWKSSLTPQERLGVELGEAAALWAAHLAWREHSKKVSGRLTASVVQGEPLNDAAAAIRRTTDGMIQRNQAMRQAEAQQAAGMPQAARMTEQLSHRWQPPG